MRQTLALFAASLLALPASAQSPALGPRDGAGLAPFDTGRLVPGSVAPDFTLRARDGRLVSLSQFRGQKHVLLVFYRGHW
jgi:cytochrome oxidase Cu insertion factor (SCO1/SenC/PrrC family)